MADTLTTSRGLDVPRKRIDFAAAFHRYGTFVIFVIILVLASYQSADFFTERNITNVLRQTSGVGIMSVGMLFVILTRGIDLSVGSVSALGSVLVAYYIQQYAPEASIGLVLLAGAACGLVAGVTVAYLRLPAFVMTLAVMTMARGFAFIISKGQPIMAGDNGQVLMTFANGYHFGVPDPVILMLVVFAVAGIVLNFTKFGRLVKAIGSNEEAVRLSGVAVPRYVLAVYVISGALAALSGVIATGRTGVGAPTVSTGAELQVIAAVVIGGASLMGGRGGVFNTLLGALILGVIANIMNLANVPGYSQQVFMGVIIMVAVLVQQGTQGFRFGR
ncbi:ABC transporter permease [Lichenifustis flavocetrariae]|uniref:ABC transporter permease n=1 Tax=Lichenifustis flavocetrariae TaxID=2949735 RepID=A0AA42CMZ1_9HYPH|nr:ABC transporter permease [Lichenifustis flavocetrariae]MCW6508882.1 ABC transporter permease [Lichenifustis flavocetrariae]